MARPLWFVKLLKKTFPSIKLLAKLSNLPILRNIFDLLLLKGDDIIYLPKDTVIKINQSVDQPDNYILPKRVLEYFIEKANYRWIMNFCICRSSMKCEDYPIELGCLFLGKSVLEINPALGRLVSKQEALDHIKNCSKAGLVHLIGRNLLDKQWLGIKEGKKLLTICNCCPCCCLWRIVPILHPSLSKKVKKIPGVKVVITEKCIGCGTCMKDICFVNAIQMRENKAYITDQCRACGRCMEICPQNAIELIIENDDYVNRAIEKIETLVNVED
ncbi:MAG: Electron transport complex subunit RsxB [Promethearchaeota archaeon]|nr:MAG: Electron transport complex subunit RsxB [Candidatus Lokiarchaeota archaeon]